MNRSEKELFIDELKRKYNKEKEKLDQIRSDVTVKKWEVLSRAYSIGKQIWGRRFTKQRLASDMEIPLTTVLRCLALDKANKRTWKLINDDKISAFKVAQICMNKCKAYQDEMVDMTIEGNLSTYQITSIKIRDFDDVSKEKHRLACENGYSRKSSAYANFQHWIERGKIFMMMDKKHMPEDKMPEIKKSLKELNLMIDKYVKHN